MSRMTIKLSDALQKDLDYCAAVKESSKAVILRNAIILFKVCISEVMKGNKVCIADKDNHAIKELVF